MRQAAVRRTAPPRRRATGARTFPESTVTWAELHISSRSHDTASLAKAMKVSTATASRIVAQLRKQLAAKGDSLVVVRDRNRHHYEIREGERTLLRRRELVAMAGFVKGGEPVLRPGETVDDVLYPKTGKCP